MICRHEHATFKVFIAGETAEEAVAEARRRGHVVDQIMASKVWTGGEQGLMEKMEAGRAARLREKPGCTRCGYLLDGLSLERGWVTCPECGLRQQRGGK